jgi:hypothetical protein
MEEEEEGAEKEENDITSLFEDHDTLFEDR